MYFCWVWRYINKNFFYLQYEHCKVCKVVWARLVHVTLCMRKVRKCWPFIVFLSPKIHQHPSPLNEGMAVLQMSIITPPILMNFINETSCKTKTNRYLTKAFQSQIYFFVYEQWSCSASIIHVHAHTKQKQLYRTIIIF